MQHLRQLLEIDNSELARLLRCSLCGLEAALNQACTELPEDPGVEVCNGVLQEIQSLLQLPQPEIDEKELIIIQSPDELKLNHLRDAFDSDPELSLYLGSSPLQSQTDADLWHEIHHKLLRVPEDLAAFWRQQTLDLVQEVGAIEDNSNLYQLPFIRDEIIYPGVSGAVHIQGLCLSQKTLLNSEFALINDSENLQLLAGFLSLYLKFIEIDPDLHHALKSVFSFDVMPLNSKLEQRIQYIEALTDRFHRTQKAEENTEALAILRAWIDMDEAIHSLVFVPPAERYSWWGKLQQESRRTLKKVADKANQAGHNIRIRQLSGLYADICAFSKDDLQLDCGGIPGEVLTCLRVYARINQEESPGRVIFRSLR
ncbi:hypothetical protein IQ259_03515 [Fortiea sp. LEGE XX443]|uniref:hypothetical protein n=1 Tax=Fortiea sp. LEGE XX443 TaxID=1828611 RepID=UPI001880E330|nr:hypothetical protein [Fortiea sp. LEGE XX443]MBE9004119.1 hypothetical protein [Fortiea sp. LEGE XX443]